MLERLKKWAKLANRDVAVLYLAGCDSRVPWHAKALASATAAYVFSPIDLIPDFIPVIGYLDDIAIVPLAIMLAVKLIPPDIMAELRREAESGIPRKRPGSKLAVAMIVLLWVVMGILCPWLVWRYLV